jgi:glycosyltransferase involved in cell wall biosynthesis
VCQQKIFPEKAKNPKAQLLIKNMAAKALFKKSAFHRKQKMEKEKIILWNAGSLPFGGTTNFATTLLKHLGKNGMSVYGISTHKINEEALKKVSEQQIPILHSMRDLFQCAKIFFAALLKKKKVILYSHGAGKMPWFLKKIIPQATYIYHECVNIPPGESVAKQCVIHADHTIVNSVFIKESIQKQVPEAKDKLIYLPSLITKPKNQKCGNRKSQPKILKYAYVGRFAEHKRIGKLIKEWPALSRELGQNSPELHVFSDISSKEKTGYEIEGNNSNIIFHPPFPNSQFAMQLKTIDCLLLPSLWEGQPLSLIEAAFIGVPFVVCEGNGCNDFIEASPDVIVCPKEWPLFLRAVHQMHKKIVSHSISSERLTKWAESRFNPSETIRKYVSFFNKL